MVFKLQIALLIMLYPFMLLTALVLVIIGYGLMFAVAIAIGLAPIGFVLMIGDLFGC